MSNPTLRNSELLTEAILLIFKANGVLLGAGDQLVSDFGLTSSRWQVLGALYGKDLTVSQIAREMGLTRQSVQRTVDALKETHLVNLIDNPAHAKAALISLTPKGESALKKATNAQIKWSSELAKTHSKDELLAAVAVLKKIIESLSA